MLLFVVGLQDQRESAKTEHAKLIVQMKISSWQLWVQSICTCMHFCIYILYGTRIHRRRTHRSNIFPEFEFSLSADRGMLPAGCGNSFTLENRICGEHRQHHSLYKNLHNCGRSSHEQWFLLSCMSNVKLTQWEWTEKHDEKKHTHKYSQHYRQWTVTFSTTFSSPHDLSPLVRFFIKLSVDWRNKGREMKQRKVRTLQLPLKVFIEILQKKWRFELSQ